MSTKITMALMAAFIASASPALAGSNGNRDTEYTYKTAQYCMPQLDELPGTTRLYCCNSARCASCSAVPCRGVAAACRGLPRKS